MLLEELELRNVCQHRHLLWQFQPGLVGIYGPNGSGKTNAMNVAAYAALTGDYSRHPQGKTGCICQQMEEGDSSFIRLVARQGDVQFTIVRGLANPEQHQLIFSGRKPITKAGEIQKHLEETLGIRRRLIDEYIFVNQWDMFAFISQQAADRAQSFARLCNTQKTETAWKALGEQIELDRPLAERVVVDGDEIRQRIGEYRKRIKDLRKQHKEGTKRLLSPEKMQEHQQGITNAATYRRLKSQLSGAQTAFRTAEGEAKLAEEAKEDAAAARARREGQIAELREAAKEAQQMLDQYAARCGQWSKKTRLRAEIANLESAAAGKPVTKETRTVAALSERIAFLTNDIQRAQNRIAAFADGAAECPTCGTPTANIQSKIDQDKRDVPQWTAERNSLREARQRRETYERAVADYVRAESIRTARLAQVQKDLEELQDVTEPDSSDVADCRKIVEGLPAAEKVQRGAQQAWELAVQQCSETASRLSTASREVSRFKSELQRVAVTEAEEEESQRIIEEQRILARNVAGWQATIAELSSLAEQEETALKKLSQILATGVRAGKWIQLASAAREKLHRDCLAAIVHQTTLENLEAQVVETLRSFQSPFCVVASRDLGFTARFANGTVMPASGLSGGQKVMLAGAFRLTVNSTFASQMGIMVLDEPTDGLDYDNRVLAADVFMRLGDRAKRNGYQIIVVTHDEVLERCFDQIIRTEKLL